MDASDCAARAKTTLGSSKNWSATASFGGVLMTSAADNPDFAGFSMALLPYCDGASFSGAVAAPAGGLHYRGHAILDAALDALLVDEGMGAPGVLQELLVTGGSAGGLATLLHVSGALERRCRP
jgi:hypothetical protein